MEDGRSVRSPAHACITDSDEIRHTAGEQLLGNRQVAPLGHSRGAFRACILEDHDGVLIDIQIRIVDAAMQVFKIFEDDGTTFMLQQPFGGRCLFEDRSIRADISAQHDQSAVGPKRTIAARDDFAVDDLGMRDVVANGLRRRRHRIEMEQIRDLVHHRGQAAGVIEIFHHELTGGL